MPGWELRVTRLGVHHNARSTPSARTYGLYQVYIDDEAVAGLSGNICERRGRGDNSRNGVTSHSRIAAGTYPLSTQFGRYRSVNYSSGETDETHPPAFRVMHTGARTAILVHPAHHPHLYLSSIGCFNPTEPLGEADDMDFTESRGRVIAMLDSLRQHDSAAFATRNNTAIANASLVITGEPTRAVPT